MHKVLYTLPNKATHFGERRFSVDQKCECGGEKGLEHGMNFGSLSIATLFDVFLCFTLLVIAGKLNHYRDCHISRLLKDSQQNLQRSSSLNNRHDSRSYTNIKRVLSNRQSSSSPSFCI